MTTWACEEPHRRIEPAGLRKPDISHARFEEVMPYTDDARCLFTVMPKGDGKPARIHFEFLDKTMSAPEPRIFFSLKKGITWEQAEELAVQLNRTVATMNITEYASPRIGRNSFFRPKLWKS